MSAIIMDGSATAAAWRAELAQRAQELEAALGRPPALQTILVGSDPASEVYIGMKIRACADVGIRSVHVELPDTASEADVLAAIHAAASDDAIDGILVQFPLPNGISKRNVIYAIPPDKDVDCFHPFNVGLMASGGSGHLLPCTPAGIIRLLDTYDVTIAGRHAVVVGRSNLVGRPAASMLLNRDATVTIAHAHTRDLGAVTRQADILVVAAGRPGLITSDMVKPGAVVIDVGINRTPTGLVGDVDGAGVSTVASMITPVPGGVGPMTVATLMANTIAAAQVRAM